MSSILFARAGGLALNLGGMVSQYVWAFVGLSVAYVSMCTLTVVLGKPKIYDAFISPEH